MQIECTQTLPQPYRWAEFLAFHGRDTRQRSELLQPEQSRLLKALMWQGQPALLELRWTKNTALAQLQGPGVAKADTPALQAMLQRMLGLTYPPGDLRAAHGKHPELGPLLRQQAGLHVPAAPTPFEALSWAIMGQQISVAVAVSLRRKLIDAAGLPLPEQVQERVQKRAPEAAQLLAYPDAAQVLQLSVEQLRTLSFSQAKAQTLLRVARAVHDDALPLDDCAAQSAAGLWSAESVDELSQQLQSIKGIGPWTVNYCLLRGYGWPDGSLHGDVAVRRAIGRLQGKEKPDAAAARIWLDQFQPFRALVAAHLWALISNQSY